MNKIIEEMANEIETARKPSTFNNGQVDVTVFKTSDDIAKYLYNAGYRKIPGNGVVLTREEYEKLGLFVETVQEYESQNGQPILVKERKVVKKSQTDFVSLLNQEMRELQISQQTRKETAEKFAERLKSHPIAKTWFLYNADGKINVVIDEICKELAEGEL
jgi:hypothetical protein